MGSRVKAGARGRSSDTSMAAWVPMSTSYTDTWTHRQTHTDAGNSSIVMMNIDIQSL